MLKNFLSDPDAFYEFAQQDGDNIVFLDLELTGLPSISGLDGRGPEVLEIAVVITNKNLKEIMRGHWVVKPSFGSVSLDSMSDWCKGQFADETKGGNNLLRDVELTGVPLTVATDELMIMLKQQCPPKMCPLAGNSVHCDREVMKERMREVYDYLSHQTIDASTIILLCRRWDRRGLLNGFRERNDNNATSNRAHRAMDDVERSIRTLEYLRDNSLRTYA
jgi:oligoribonuclease